jgi:hypothetical protein
LSQALQLVACGLALAFIADEWSDHAVQARVRSFIVRQRVEFAEPEPVEVQPGPGEVAQVIASATRITRKGV